MTKTFILALSMLGFAAVASADDLALLNYCESLAKSNAVQISDVKAGIQQRLSAESMADLNMTAAKTSNMQNTQALDAIKTRGDIILAKTKHFSYANYTLTITGANLNVRHAWSPSTADNGLGNIIIGNNNLGNGPRTGSMNLIVGTQNSWEGRLNLIGGVGNWAEGSRNVILSGYQGRAYNDGGIILTGTTNRVYENYGVIVSGAQNFASGRGVVFTGTNNASHAGGGIILTGESHLITSAASNGFLGTGFDSYVDTSGGIGVSKLGVLNSMWEWKNTDLP